MKCDNVVTLLLFPLLLHGVICNIYYVTPDDPDSMHKCEGHHCHNLQHYLLNITKYFTSNTQLLFLPGLHHLHTDLIIKNVHNISLIGGTANGITLDTVIQCNSSVGIVMTNITNLTIEAFIINDCRLYYSEAYISSSVIIEDCNDVAVCHLQINEMYSDYSIMAINILGKSHFSHLRETNIVVYYTETKVEKQHHNFLIDHYQITSNKHHKSVVTVYAELEIYMHQISYQVTVQLSHAIFQHARTQFLFVEDTSNLSNNVLIISCWFHFNYVHLISVPVSGHVQFSNCQFLHNTSPWLIDVVFANITIANSTFYNNVQVLRTYSKTASAVNVTIENTNFTCATCRDQCKDFIKLSHSNLLITGQVTFDSINNYYSHSIISLAENSTITVYGELIFTRNHARNLISLENNFDQYMIIKENTVINISQNQVCTLFATNIQNLKSFYFPYCFFQYLSSKTITKLEDIENRNFSIIFHNNLYYKSDCYNHIPIIKCLWVTQSTFKNIDPFNVNSKYICYNGENNTGIYYLNSRKNTLCICSDETHYNCHIDDLGYLYPGQTLTAFLRSNEDTDSDSEIITKTDVNLPYIKSCIVQNPIAEHKQVLHKNCSQVSYTIAFPTENWCYLLIKKVSDFDIDVNVFYVRKLICPVGFAEINKICQCDSVITNFKKMITCNINDQTILRPANSWISATTTHNNSYTYHISLHCPFHYCLPHSSHLNFSTPNSQCQFNRSGLLCGHCQQGLSTVFSSLNCQQCSNTYLLLIIPIAIIGFIVVFLLFYLNLTITDGTINAFILYANIISINSPIFFSQTDKLSPAYTFISFENLDLGIQICFYNGMDDYAKMWSQLAFPFYLIFIATLIIITSRYSITIQRLTARRALPVLATLFLLSYTKILRIVSSVLFFYSTITHLPSKHTTLVWSVDANVPLFGVRFTILFIVCLILFLILVPFNVILLFTRTLSRFKIINRFKPLLDAYQGPYKISYYYYTGVQLLIRVIFFALSSLERNINLVLGTILLSMLIGIHGIISPLQNKVKNFQELLYMINLQILFVVALYDHQVMSPSTINILFGIAAFHFVLIIIYHIFTYSCNNAIKTKARTGITTLSGWITTCRILSTCHNNRRLVNEVWECHTRNEIPEAVNYHHYRETLLNEHY